MMTVSVVAPAVRPIEQRVAASGSILPWQEVTVGTELSGYRLASLNADVGSRVRKGQVLATIDAAVLRAELQQHQADVAEAEASLAEAEANASRARALKDTGALSARDADQLLTGERTARARLESAKARLATADLRLQYTQVRAPDDGVISSRTATPGQMVNAGAELFRLIRQGRLEWRAELQESDFARVRPGMPVQLTDVGGQQVDGKVRAVAPSLDDNTRLGVAYVDLPETASLRAGMFAQGHIIAGGADGLTVPFKAVVPRDGYSYVFVVGANDVVAQRRVELGIKQGGFAAVTSGLAANERIVLDGAGFLKDGDRVTIGERVAGAGT